MRQKFLAICGVTGLAAAAAATVWQLQPPAHAQQPRVAEAGPEGAIDPAIAFSEAQESAPLPLAQDAEPSLSLELLAEPPDVSRRRAIIPNHGGSFDLLADPPNVTAAAAEAALDPAFSSDPGLREQYVELLRKKAELMNDGEISVALEQLRAEIHELEAGRTLESISAELRALIESHPGTRAARRAQAMLNAPDPGEGPYYPATPTPARSRPLFNDGDEPAPSNRPTRSPPGQLES